MTRVSRPPRTGWWRFFLAALAAALISLLGAGTASAATLPNLETRVGATAPVAQVLVGPHECITAGQRWGHAPPQGDVAAGSCVAAKTGGEILRPLSKIEASTLDDALRPAKLDHVFVPKHNFDPLVTRYGSREDAMEQIVRGLSGPDIPSAGRFEVNRVVGGQDVVIRGAVVDGVPRIGTAFTP